MDRNDSGVRLLPRSLRRSERLRNVWDVAMSLCFVLLKFCLELVSVEKSGNSLPYLAL